MSQKTSNPVRIEGLHSIPEEEVRGWIAPQLEFIETSGVSMARADDASFFLESSLRDRGFKQATVEWQLADRGDGRKQIVLQVNEGQAVVIRNVRVNGNQAIENDAVEELLTSETTKRLAKNSKDALPYVQNDIDKGRARALEFYQLMGFPHAEVNWEPEVVTSAQVDLVVTITEGTRYEVGKITLPEAPVKNWKDKYEEIIEGFEGKSFSAAIPANLSARVSSLATNSGYYDAVVTTAVSERQPIAGEDVVQVDLVVNAAWGDLVKVSSINVTGNEKVERKFFDRHFEEVVGGGYSPDGVNRDVEELLQTGAFETVRTYPVRQEDGSVALDVEVKEAPSRQLGVYAGFATWEGPLIGFEFRNLNLLGSVRKADAELEFSRRGVRGEIEYSDPWFVWSDYALRTSIFAMNRVNEGYEAFETGGRYELSKKFGRQMNHSIALFGKASYADVHDADIADAFLGDQEYFSHAPGISYTYDKRDNPRAPRSGFIVQGSLSAASSAVGSEVEFIRATGKLGFYFPVGESTLRLSARAGTISPIGDTDDIPIDLRFFNGGAQSVRSFQERALGPRGSTYPIGGEFYTIFNLEYEIPFLASYVDGVSLVPFVDAGNLLPDADDASLDMMKYAIGLGIRYKTPIGPLRVEYGMNPDPDVGDPEGTFHLGFGVAY